MKILIFTVTLIFTVIQHAYCQKTHLKQVHLKQVHKKPIITQAESFSIKTSGWKKPMNLQIEKDTVSIGNAGYRGEIFYVMTKEDTLKVEYVNTPYRQTHYIPIHSPKGKTILILTFQEQTADFSESYMKQNTGRVQYEIPETYELANIIWALSPSGKGAQNLYRDHDYYNKVEKHFKPYLNHPIFKSLNFSKEEYLQNYYSFRENSICFSFKDNKLVYDGPYYHVFGNSEYFDNLFKELKPQVEDFAKKSNFRKFYRENQPYYQSLIQRQKQLLPVQDMWRWLENNFPDKFDSYKVVFSPLIGSSHSTQQFWVLSDSRTTFFKEAVMFISGPQTLDAKGQLTEEQKKGLQSGIVFTEIDHNYVNPTSNKYRKVIDSVFTAREVWTSPGGDTKFYGTPMAVFNEYMTHALFSLYILDNYDAATADFIIGEREKLMVDRRKYVKFREFNKALIDLYAQRKASEKVVDLYPRILAWSKLQK